MRPCNSDERAPAKKGAIKCVNKQGSTALTRFFFIFYFRGLLLTPLGSAFNTEDVEFVTQAGSTPSPKLVAPAKSSS